MDGSFAENVTFRADAQRRSKRFVEFLPGGVVVSVSSSAPLDSDEGTLQFGDGNRTGLEKFFFGEEVAQGNVGGAHVGDFPCAVDGAEDHSASVAMGLASGG